MRPPAVQQALEPVTDLTTFPLRLLAPDLMRIWQVKPARFYALKRAGAFDRFLLKPTIGRPAWSREKVQKYLEGEAPASSGWSVVRSKPA